MPKTKGESVVFTLLMAFGMVYCMTVYSIATATGHFQSFMLLAALREMWVEYIIVFFVVLLITTDTAKKLAFRFVTPGKDTPILITVSIQFMMVCQMVPLMTLIASFLHPVEGKNIFEAWIQTAVLAFPFALCIQLFFIGPLVRFLFKTMKTYIIHPA